MKRNLEIKPNIVTRIFENAEAFPDRVAIQLDDGTQVTYGEFLKKVQNARAHLRAQSLKKNDKVLLLVGSSQEVLVVFCALCAEGVAVVLTDPSLGLKRIFWSLKHSGAHCVISIKKVFRLQFLSWSLLRAKKIEAEALLLPSQTTVTDAPAQMKNHEVVFLSYTSGSTGTPKSVPRDHATISHQQIYALKYLPEVNPDIHLCGYTVSALQNLVEGSTTILPQASAIDNLKILQNNHVTRVSGPPGFIDDLVTEALFENCTFPEVKSVLLGGAPLQNWLCQNIQSVFPNCEITVIYGSTECEPIAAAKISAKNPVAQNGYLAGTPIEEISLKLFEHEALDQNQFNEVTVGEVCLCGPNVVKKYFNSDRDEKRLKVTDSTGNTWHRTGDIGTFDSHGQLWLLGRYNHSDLSGSTPLYNGLIESRIESLPGIRRAAMIARDGKFHLYIEPMKGAALDPQVIEKELQKLQTPHIRVQVRNKPLPVDRRHRWKIDKSLIFK